MVEVPLIIVGFCQNWVGLIPSFLHYFSSFCSVLHFRESLLPTGFKRGWDKSVRNVKMLCNVDNPSVLHRFFPTIGEIGLLRDIPEQELTVISVQKEKNPAFPAPLSLYFSQRLRKKGRFLSSEQELTVWNRKVGVRPDYRHIPS